MKKTKSFLLRLSAVMLLAFAMMFGAMSVSAVYEEQDTNISAEQMAYDDYYDDYYDDGHYNTASRSGNTDWGRTIGTSLVVSIVGSIVAVIFVYHGYKFNGRTEPYQYTRKAPLELTDSEDVLVDKYLKTERIERR